MISFCIKDVSKTYGLKGNEKVHALSDINIQFPASGMFAIVGRSGSGKSTLLNIIGGIDKPSSGTVSLEYAENEAAFEISSANERELNWYRNSELGFVFQSFNLVNEWNVYDNIAVTLEQQNYTEAEINELVREALKFVDLEGYERRMPYEMSGGQLQRVAVARAIAKQPSIVLADEPTGNLDSQNGKMIMELLKKVSKKCLVLVVTHNEDDASLYADEILRMSDGRISEGHQAEEPSHDISQTDTALDAATEASLRPKRDIRKIRPLPLRTILSIAGKSLKRKMVKSIISVLTMTLIVSAIYFCGLLLNTNPDKAACNYYNRLDMDFIYSESNAIRRYSEKQLAIIDECYGAGNYYGIIETEAVSSVNNDVMDVSVIVGGKADSKYSLVGEMPVKGNEIVVSDFLCESLEGKLKPTESPIGKCITINGLPMVISGYFKTGVTIADYYTEVAEQGESLVLSLKRVLASNEYLNYLMESKDYIEIPASIPYEPFFFTYLDRKLKYASMSKLESVGYYSFNEDAELSDESLVISADFGGFYNFLNYDFSLHDYKFSYKDIHTDYYYGIYDGYLNLYDYYPRFSIDCVVIPNYEPADIYISDAKYEQIKQAFYKSYMFDAYEIVPGEKRVLTTAEFSKLYNNLFLKIYGVRLFYDAKSEIDVYRDAYKAASLLLSAILVLFMILFFSFSVKEKHKKIGIMRALGITEYDVSKMILLENLIVTVSSVILSLLVSYIGYQKVNSFLKSQYGLKESVLTYDFVYGGTVILMVFAMFALCILIPIFTMVKDRPVKMLRDMQ